jgi:hypothetical protein
MYGVYANNQNRPLSRRRKALLARWATRQTQQSALSRCCRQTAAMCQDVFCPNRESGRLPSLACGGCGRVSLLTLATPNRTGHPDHPSPPPPSPPPTQPSPKSTSNSPLARRSSNAEPVPLASLSQVRVMCLRRPSSTHTVFAMTSPSAEAVRSCLKIRA